MLLYTGTTGFRHTDGINGGRPVVQAALEAAGYTVDWEDCTNNGGGATNCDNANKNPRIFTDENLARYDAIVLLNSSAGPPGPLWNDAQKASIIKYVQNGGGIAGVHNATDMGTTAETWNWWDGNNGNSVVGATMAGHAATEPRPTSVRSRSPTTTTSPRATCRTTYGFGDEHYNFRRNVRGTHHVLADDRRAHLHAGRQRHGPGPPGHVVQALRRRQHQRQHRHAQVLHATAARGSRRWATSAPPTRRTAATTTWSSTIVGGVRWVAGEGRKSDCSGTVWSSFTRTVLVPDANNPIGIDVAKDGKVYWSEIGNPISAHVDGLREDARPGQAGRQQDHGHLDPDARRPRQLRGRRPGHEPAAGLRPRRPEQAQHLRLLLAAQPGLAEHRQRPGRRLQPDQPLHADRRRHRRGARTPSA